MQGGTGCFPCSGKSEKADRHAEDIVRYAETPYSALTAVQKSESSQQDSGANHIDEPLVYVEHGKNERRNDYCKTLFFFACEHPEKVFMKSASCKELLDHHRHRIENPAGIRRSPFPKARSGRKETRRGFQKNKLDKHQKRKSCGRYDGVDKDGFFYSFYPQSPDTQRKAGISRHKQKGKQSAKLNESGEKAAFIRSSEKLPYDIQEYSGAQKERYGDINEHCLPLHQAHSHKLCLVKNAQDRPAVSAFAGAQGGYAQIFAASVRACINKAPVAARRDCRKN